MIHGRRDHRSRSTTLHLGRATSPSPQFGDPALEQITLEGQGYAPRGSPPGPLLRRLIENADTTGSQESCRIVNLESTGKVSGARVDAGLRIKRTLRHDHDPGRLRPRLQRDRRPDRRIRREFRRPARGRERVVTTSAISVLHQRRGPEHLDERLQLRASGEEHGRLYINGTTTKSGQNVGCRVSGFYTEIVDTMSVGILVDGAANWRSTTTRRLQAPRNEGGRGGEEHRLGHPRLLPSNLTVRNLWSESDTLVLDKANGVRSPPERPQGESDKGLACTPHRRHPARPPRTAIAATARSSASSPASSDRDRVGAHDSAHPDGSFHRHGQLDGEHHHRIGYFLWKSPTSSSARRSGSIPPATSGSTRRPAISWQFLGRYDILALLWDGSQWNEFREA